MSSTNEGRPDAAADTYRDPDGDPEMILSKAVHPPDKAEGDDDPDRTGSSDETTRDRGARDAG